MSRTAYDAAVATRERADSLSAAERSALRKTAWRFLPLLTIAYLFNYLDRTAIGVAALTMNADLGITNTQLGFAAGLFFLTYTLCEVPSNLALYRFGARRWIARIMISWGLISAAVAFVSDVNSLYALRLLLGAAEAGFFPGIAFFLSQWFPREHRTRVLAWFLIGIPASSAIGGPLSIALLQMDGLLGLAGWKWLFIMVSLPCVLLGFVVLKVLADRPDEASWLNKEESSALKAMLAAETHDRPKTSVLGAILDIRIAVLALVQFGFTLGSYGIGIWMPLILREEGLGDSEIALLLFLPYAAAILGMLGWAWLADRTGNKIGNLTLACLLGAAGFGRDISGRARLRSAHREPDARACRHHGGARHLLVDPAAPADGHRRRKRYRLHQHGGYDRRLRRALHDGRLPRCHRRFRATVSLPWPA